MRRVLGLILLVGLLPACHTQPDGPIKMTQGEIQGFDAQGQPTTASWKVLVPDSAKNQGTLVTVKTASGRLIEGSYDSATDAMIAASKLNSEMFNRWAIGRRAALGAVDCQIEVVPWVRTGDPAWQFDHDEEHVHGESQAHTISFSVKLAGKDQNGTAICHFDDEGHLDRSQVVH